MSEAEVKKRMNKKNYQDIKMFKGFNNHEATLDILTKNFNETTLKELKESSSILDAAPKFKSNNNEDPVRGEHVYSDVNNGQPLRRILRTQRFKTPSESNSTTANKKPTTKSTRAIHKTKQSVATNIISTTQNFASNSFNHNLQFDFPRPKQQTMISKPKVRLLSEMASSSPLVKTKSMNCSNSTDKGKATVVLTETINARFTGTDWTEGYVNLLGKVTFNYQKDDIPALMKNLGKITTYKCHLNNIDELQEIIVNDEWLKCPSEETTDSSYVFLVDVQKMLSLLRQKTQEEPSKSFYSLEAFTYKINSLDKMKSCPLLLSPKWATDDSKTELKLKYKYNSSSMSNVSPLKDVRISVHIESGFDEAMANPAAEKILVKENKISWNLGNIDAANSIGNIVAEFQLDHGPTEFGIVTAEFKSPKNSISGVRFKAENEFPIRDVVTRIFAGKYDCEEPFD